MNIVRRIAVIVAVSAAPAMAVENVCDVGGRGVVDTHKILGFRFGAPTDREFDVAFLSSGRGPGEEAVVRWVNSMETGFDCNSSRLDLYGEHSMTFRIAVAGCFGIGKVPKGWGFTYTGEAPQAADPIAMVMPFKCKMALPLLSDAPQLLDVPWRTWSPKIHCKVASLSVSGLKLKTVLVFYSEAPFNQESSEQDSRCEQTQTECAVK
ncbi:MAG: hypothetical protein LBJ92_03840 [Holosporales bacterium]|jgi:hypothetical protein|nr:hypothetical protein [Holosporales bacterium]